MTVIRSGNRIRFRHNQQDNALLDMEQKGTLYCMFFKSKELISNNQPGKFSIHALILNYFILIFIQNINSVISLHVKFTTNFDKAKKLVRRGNILML